VVHVSGGGRRSLRSSGGGVSGGPFTKASEQPVADWTRNKSSVTTGTTSP